MNSILELKGKRFVQASRKSGSGGAAMNSKSIVTSAQLLKLESKLEQIKKERERVFSVSISPSEKLNELLVSRETAALKSGCKLSELIKRPQLNYDLLKEFDVSRPELPYEIFEQVEIEIKYEGYIKRQFAQAQEIRRLEVRTLDETLDYKQIVGLRMEAREKLNKVKPKNLGQASRISGVSPADISVLMIYLKKSDRKNKEE